VRFVARIQERAQLRLVPIDGSATLLLREDDTNGNGWLDYPSARPLPDGPRALDLRIEPETGNVHLVVVDYANPAVPTQRVLTPHPEEVAAGTGGYEVLSIIGYHAPTGRAFVLTTHAGPMERHLYAVDVNGVAPPVRLSPAGVGYYGASFSSGGGFYLLSYDGPDVPRQDLYAYTAEGASVLAAIETNDALRTRLQDYALCKFVYSEVTLGPNLSTPGAPPYQQHHKHRERERGTAHTQQAHRRNKRTDTA
jgi:dipeptidyl-peptidase 4